jgi:hypothetical protein
LRSSSTFPPLPRRPPELGPGTGRRWSRRGGGGWSRACAGRAPWSWRSADARHGAHPPCAAWSGRGGAPPPLYPRDLPLLAHRGAAALARHARHAAPPLAEPPLRASSSVIHLGTCSCSSGEEPRIELLRRPTPSGRALLPFQRGRPQAPAPRRCPCYRFSALARGHQSSPDSTIAFPVSPPADKLQNLSAEIGYLYSDSSSYHSPCR